MCSGLPRPPDGPYPQPLRHPSVVGGGHTPVVHFPDLEVFQQWYGSVLNAGPADAFINVPIQDLPGEYLVVRPSAVQGIRVEPVYGALTGDEF